MSRPYMPTYWGDYLRDTRHLSLEEHGAYLMLIAHYWERGCLPNDDERLARILGISKLQWKKLKPSIEVFFNHDWTHERIEQEIEKSEKKSQKNRENGEAGGKKKQSNKLKNEGSLSNEINETDLANATPNALANALANDLAYPYHTIVDTNVSTERASQAKPARSKKRTSITENYQPTDADKLAAEKACLSQAEFRSEWGKFRDWHVSKGTLNANWQAAWRTWLSKVSEFSPKQRAGPAFRKPINGSDACLSVLSRLDDFDERTTENYGQQNAIDGEFKVIA